MKRFLFSVVSPLWLLRVFLRAVNVPSILLLVLGIPVQSSRWQVKRGTAGRSRCRSPQSAAGGACSALHRGNACLVAAGQTLHSLLVQLICTPKILFADADANSEQASAILAAVQLQPHARPVIHCTGTAARKTFFLVHAISF